VVRTPPSPIRRFLPLAVLLAALAPVFPVQAQNQPDSANPDSPADIRQPGGRLVLVLPFDNRSGQSNLGWIGDSFPYTLDQRLNSAGFLTIGRDDRVYALDHLGLPPDFRPSRATTLRIAQTLDADFVVVGSFTVENGRILVQAQVLEVNQLRMSGPLTDSADLPRLFDVENAIAWKVAQRMDSHFAIAEQTFLSAAGGVRLSSFEDYIRGTSAPTSDERLKRLQAAVAETPDYTAALLALGKEQYAASQFEAAAATLAKVPSTIASPSKPASTAASPASTSQNTPKPRPPSPSSPPACRCRRWSTIRASPKAARAKTPRRSSSRSTPPTPTTPTTTSTLAVALLGRGDIAGATREVQSALNLHSDDPEATELLTRLQATHGSTTNLKAIIGAEGFDPTTRIRRTWSEASFRQVAFQLDQMRAIQMSRLPPAEQAVQYGQLGVGYLAQGLLPEAEQEFQTALTADPNNAIAHAGIAQVRERSGSARRRPRRGPDLTQARPQRRRLPRPRPPRPPKRPARRIRRRRRRRPPPRTRKLRRPRHEDRPHRPRPKRSIANTQDPGTRPMSDGFTV
jgi:TolB-like protein